MCHLAVVQVPAYKTMILPSYCNKAKHFTAPRRCDRNAAWHSVSAEDLSLQCRKSAALSKCKVLGSARCWVWGVRGEDYQTQASEKPTTWPSQPHHTGRIPGSVQQVKASHHQCRAQGTISLASYICNTSKTVPNVWLIALPDVVLEDMASVFQVLVQKLNDQAVLEKINHISNSDSLTKASCC